MRRATFLALVVLIAGGAAALRLPKLDLRPMHGDEAVHAYKLNELRETGRYVYDPFEYHGPTLNYCTLPILWIGGVSSFGDMTAGMLRLVPVLFGIGLILLLPLVADGLGRRATLVAALLACLSPALVFYCRDYIQETLLVFFTFACIATGWRYARSGRPVWALLCGASLGLMQATKETCLVSVGALGLALACTLVWEARTGTQPLNLKKRLRWRVFLLAALAGGGVSALFFSGFFTNAQGPVDAWRAYGIYFGRADGDGEHVQPWYYYLRMLLWSHHAPLPIWSEGLILLLAVAGIAAAFVRRRRNGATESGSTALPRFLAIYCVALVVVYSAIPYKTPWCAIQFLQPLTLLAGYGAVALLRAARKPVLQAAVAVLLLALAANLGGQALAASYRYCTRYENPYVYAQPVSDVERLATWVEKLAAVSPDGHETVVHVIATYEWPLPWYLRRFVNVGYWNTVPEECDAPIVVVSLDLMEEVQACLQDTYQVSTYGLRPAAQLCVLASEDLYEMFAASQTPATRPGE